VFEHERCGADQALLARLRSMLEEVRALECAVDDPARIDQLGLLEDLKRSICAVQARVTDAFARSQRAAQIEAGVRSDRASRGVADQVARARRGAPSRGDTHVGLARALVQEMPCTMEALSTGRIDEWTATGLVRETAVLSLEHRVQVDAELVGMLAEDGRSHGELVRAARCAAQRLDAAAAARRAAKAVSDRRLSIRPAPDTMVWVGALLPVVDGVATYASLDRDAASVRASGDPRGRGQLMADLLVQRVTGRDPLTTPADVRLELVMGDTTLLGDTDDPGRDEPATVRARGLAPLPVPAPVARALVARSGAAGRAWLRRLFQSPQRDRLAAMDSRSRLFPTCLAELIALDDQTCRAPWCDAPIRASDHVRSVADDGDTSRENGQGLCERCNLAKEAPGWRAARAPDGRVTSTTPTGHSTTTRPPPPLGLPTAAPGRARGPVDLVFAVPWHRRAA
jgi:hypothetical protein